MACVCSVMKRPGEEYWPDMEGLDFRDTVTDFAFAVNGKPDFIMPSSQVCLCPSHRARHRQGSLTRLIKQPLTITNTSWFRTSWVQRGRDCIAVQDVESSVSPLGHDQCLVLHVIRRLFGVPHILLFELIIHEIEEIITSEIVVSI
jgi:hypothetical protein